MAQIRRELAFAVLWAIVIALALLARFLRDDIAPARIAFDPEVVRVLEARCVMCHFEGGPSFPLETFDQARARDPEILSSVMDRQMPPWAAADGPHELANANRLSPSELQLLTDWIAGKVSIPSGARPQARLDGWQLGKPDLVRKLPEVQFHFEEAASVKNVVVDLQLPSDRRVRTIEYLPGNRSLARAAFFRVQETGDWIGSWTPWFGFTTVPNGAAHVLPRGAHIVAELHYGSSGDQAVDQGTLGLFFADSNATVTVSTATLELTAADATIPRKLFGKLQLKVDTDILAFLPEIEDGIESLEVSARSPAGVTSTLLATKSNRLDWPTSYVFKTPVSLSTGTLLTATVTFKPDTPPPGMFRIAISRATP